MSSKESLVAPGLIVAVDGEPADKLGELAHSILEDITYNIVHDLLLQTHREEKTARANSAAIIVEQKAEGLQAAQDDSSLSTAQPQIVETEAATYISHGDNGTPEVHLKDNPLKTTMEIRCGRCKLPRLLYPTDGNGTRKPELGKEYCKKRPFISKPYHDIYGQTFVPEGPGRGKKKKDMVNPLKAQAAKEGTPSGSQDSPTASPPSEGPAKPISFPHAKCQNCNTFLPIKRMNNHMVKCIGGGGRGSSRAALIKMQNGSGNGSQNGSTPPASRQATPVPGGLKDNKRKSSPNKREAEDFDSDDSPHKKKKLMKKTIPIVPPKSKLKAPGMMRSTSQHSASNLSFEQKVPNSEDEDEDDGSGDGDGEDDREYGTVVVEPKKKKKAALEKKLKEAENKEKKKKLLSPNTAAKPILPPTRPLSKPSDAALAAMKARNGVGVNGKDKDAQSESSQTLSSPN